MPDRLYIDVDDTLIAEFFKGSGYDLRPGVVTQLAVLGKLFDCMWLTHRSQEDLERTFDGLFAERMLKKFGYARWKETDGTGKANYVLGQTKDFYWLEDPLSTGDMHPIKDAGLSDRYIPVDPKGPWGFTEALFRLFAKASIGEKEIAAAGGKIGWFGSPLADVERRDMMPAGTLRSGFVSNGKQHCGDCIHRTGPEKEYCIHPEVVKDPELISRVKQVNGKNVIPIVNATECCGYVYKEANAEDEE